MTSRMTDSTPLVEKIIDRTLERLRGLHDYAGRPAWEQVIAEEMRAALDASGNDERLKALKLIADDNSWRGFSPLAMVDRMRETARAAIAPTQEPEQ